MEIKNNSSNISESFKHAIRGFSIAFTTQRNIKIEILWLLLISILSINLRLNLSDFFKIITSSIIVLITELLNTAIEFLVDLVVGETWNKEAKYVKDIAASAVLLSVIWCVIVTLLVFYQYIKT